jgi:hypothetical protein
MKTGRKKGGILFWLGIKISPGKIGGGRGEMF